MRAAFIYSLGITISLSMISGYAWANPDHYQQDEGELLFVFNQPEYAPGDTAYFTGYILPKRNQLVTSKVIVGIKLIGPGKGIFYHGRVLFQGGVGISQIIIPNDIKPGSYQFVSYIETGSMKESPVFNTGHLVISSKNLQVEDDPYVSQLEKDSSKFIIATDTDKYGRRSKVKLSVMPGSLLNSRLNSVSITVYNEILFKDTGQNTLSSVVFTKRPSQRSALERPTKSPDFPNYFMGKAFIKSTAMSIPDSSKITFYLNESDFVYVVYTDADGNFSFPLFKNFGNEKVFYRITHKGKLLRDSEIALYDPFIVPETIGSKMNDTLSAYGFYARQKQFVNSSYNYFVTKDIKGQARTGYESDLETDNEYLLDQYEPFYSMAEIFSNIITSVRYRKESNNERIRVFLKQTAKYGNEDPLYIVNGFMTEDTRYVLKLDPKMVRRIAVLRSNETLTRFGDLGMDGIIEIETYDWSSIEKINNSESSFYVIGINKTLEFKEMVYGQSQSNARVPDLRSCLYWNPKVDINRINEFEFYTSDDIGYYNIQVAGLVDGKLILTRKRFTVSQEVKK